MLKGYFWHIGCPELEPWKAACNANALAAILSLQPHKGHTYTLRCSEVTPGSVLSNYSCTCSGYHIGCWGWNPGRPHARTRQDTPKPLGLRTCCSHTWKLGSFRDPGSVMAKLPLTLGSSLYRPWNRLHFWEALGRFLFPRHQSTMSTRNWGVCLCPSRAISQVSSTSAIFHGF